MKIQIKTKKAIFAFYPINNIFRDYNPSQKSLRHLGKTHVKGAYFSSSLHVYYEKLWFCCLDSVQGSPSRQTMLTTKAAIKNVEIYIVRAEGGGGRVGGGWGCIVKWMGNFARTFAKMSQVFWKGL